MVQSRWPYVRLRLGASGAFSYQTWASISIRLTKHLSFTICIRGKRDSVYVLAGTDPTRLAGAAIRTLCVRARYTFKIHKFYYESSTLLLL